MVVLPSRVPELMVEALRTAVAGCPGPVHLDVPCDVGMLPCEVDLDALPDSIRPYRTVPLPEHVDEAVRLFAGARKPLIIVGGGVNRSEAEAEFRRLLDLTGVPATSTFNAKGVIPPDYPGYLGTGGLLAGSAMIRATREADVILSVGCKFSSWVLIDKKPNYAKPEHQKIIQLDVEPKAIGRNVDVDLGLVGDARETLKLLIAALESQPMRMDADWASGLQADHAAYMATMDEVADAVYSTIGGGELLNEAAIARTIAREIPEDAIVCFDGGEAMQWYHTFVHPRDGRSSLYNPGMGHLGSGLPFANAAKLNNPDRPVFCLAGDGSFGLTVSELETAARNGLDIICIVCNDSHWGMYRALGEYVYQNPSFGTALTSVQFSIVAKGFGCDGERVEKLEDLPGAIQRGVQSSIPYVIDVVCDWTPHPQDPRWGDGMYPDWSAAMAQAVATRTGSGEESPGA
jgi:acetolactate synthase-1/2/3 large subunit